MPRGQHKISVFLKRLLMVLNRDQLAHFCFNHRAVVFKRTYHAKLECSHPIQIPFYNSSLAIFTDKIYASLRYWHRTGYWLRRTSLKMQFRAYVLPA
jgi:hypothetical protein